MCVYYIWTKKCALIVFGQKNVCESFSRLPRNFPDQPETILTIRKLSRLSWNFPGYLETLQVSRNFPGYPETFQAIQKLSRLSRFFSDHPENIQPIQKLSRLSRNFPGYPEICWIIWKISSLSRNFQSRNFPKGPETPHCNFRGYVQNFPDAQKLSVWQCHPGPCHPGFWASLDHSS